MAAKFRSFQPAPGPVMRVSFWLWLLVVAVYCLGNAWLPLAVTRPAGHILLLVGLMAAFAHALVGVATASMTIWGRALVLGIGGFLVLGPENAALWIGAQTRLAVNQAAYSQALDLYHLTGEAECDCILSDIGGSPVSGFRWERGEAAWVGVVFDPGERLNVRPMALGGTIVLKRLLKPGWSYVWVERGLVQQPAVP